MLQNILLLLVISANSCANFSGQNRHSQWSELDDTRSVSCDSWPIAGTDLDTDDILVLQTQDKIGLVGKTKQRDGSTQFQFYPFEGSTSLDTSNRKSMSFGVGAIALGNDFGEGGKSIAVVHNRGSKQATVKFHEINGNVVSMESSNIGGEVYAGSMIARESGYWLLLNREGYQVAYVDAKPNKGILPVRHFPEIKVNTRPILVPHSEQNSAFIIEHDRNFQRNNQAGQFSVRSLLPSGQVSQPIFLTALSQGAVETWTAAAYPGGMALAVVSGDSMIGQGTLNLSTQRITYGAGTSEWNKSISLRNLHVSAPVITSSRHGSWALLLKWIDGESTLAAYKFGRTGAESKQHFGVFPKGTSLVTAFQAEESGELVAVVRNKVGYRWNYEICSLGSPD